MTNVENEKYGEEEFLKRKWISSMVVGFVCISSRDSCCAG